MQLAGYEYSDLLTVPAKHDYGIGIVGCGGIVNYAHLPAYRQHDLRVLACFDANPETAAATAGTHGIATVYQSLDQLLADPGIEIVDIAVTPWAQPEIAARVIAAGKHLLCQKPLASTYKEAERIVALAHQAGVKLAVNQQMRWDAGIRVSRQLMEQGAIGTPVDGRIEVSIRTPWHLWPWIAEQRRVEVMYHSIHYLDSVRSLFGDPASLTAIHSKWPHQPEVGETRTQTILNYPDALRVLIDVNHHNWSSDAYARFRWLGTDGLITGTLGLLYDYPTGRVDTLEYESAAAPGVPHVADLTTRWIPDAFIGPMASLMEAIQTGGAAMTSGGDNLGTLRCVFGAYDSAASGRSVSLD